MSENLDQSSQSQPQRRQKTSSEILKKHSLPTTNREGLKKELGRTPFERSQLRLTIVNWYRKLCEDRGYVVGVQALNRLSRHDPSANPSVHLVKNLFGSMRALRKAAGLKLTTGAVLEMKGPPMQSAHFPKEEDGRTKIGKVECSKSIIRSCPLTNSFIHIPAEAEPIAKALSSLVTAKTTPTEYKRIIVELCVGDLSSFMDEHDLSNSLTTITELYKTIVQTRPDLSLENVAIPFSTETSPRKTPRSPSPHQSLPIETLLKARLFGQDDAVDVVCTALKRRESGLDTDPETGLATAPVGSFLFCGNTGVGKTELAKAIAEVLFGSRKSLTRIDCSEYSNPHEYAKLIGAPPGYIGYDDGGILTESVKRNPKQVVLFDEIEKAHYKLHNLLLQLMDEGELSDGKGNTINFRECLIIQSSNLGLTGITAFKGRPGFHRTDSISEDDRSATIMRAVTEFFAPEYVNRLSATVIFNEIDKNTAERILEHKLSRKVKAVRRKGRQLVIPDEVHDFIISKVQPPTNGRHIERRIHRYVEKPYLAVSENGAGIYRFSMNREKTGVEVHFSPARRKK